MEYAAVITAGGTVDEEFAAVIGSKYKALATVRGTTLIERTVLALRDAGIAHIAVVAGDEVAERCRGSVERIVPQGSNGAQNVWLALNSWNEPTSPKFLTPLIYATCDLPYITGAAVSAFLQSASENELAIPLTEFAQFERRFPGAPPFGITLGGERVVNGGIFSIPAPHTATVEALALRLFNARKKPLEMARIAGSGVALRLLVGHLGVGDLEYRARQLLGIPARAIRNAPAELAYDIDTLAEYRYAVANS